MKYFGTLPRRRLQDSALLPLRQLPQRRGPIEDAGAGAPRRCACRARDVRVGWRIPAELDAARPAPAGAGPPHPGRAPARRPAGQAGWSPTPRALDVAVALSRALPAERTLTVTLLVEPARAAEAAGAARAVVERLARAGPAANELASARQQLQADTQAAEASRCSLGRPAGGLRLPGRQAGRAGPGRRASWQSYSGPGLVDLLRRCVTGGPAAARSSSRKTH